jgi:hypothetical protein
VYCIVYSNTQAVIPKSDWETRVLAEGKLKKKLDEMYNGINLDAMTVNERTQRAIDVYVSNSTDLVSKLFCYTYFNVSKSTFYT